MHRRSRNDIALVISLCPEKGRYSINDECLNTNPTDPSGNIKRRRQRPQHPKERKHAHRNKIQYEKVDKELSRCSRQIRQEVNDNIETSNLDKHNGYIRRKLRQRIRRRAIKRECLVF